MSRLRTALLLALLAWPLVACRPQPVAIDYGRDQCAYCRMLVVDSRYGAELVTRTGKVYTFDSIECLAAFRAEGRVPAEETHSMWVTDFAEPGRLVPAEAARYLRSPQLRSPMGLNLAAFAGREALAAAGARYGGEEVTWKGIETLVRESGFMERSRRHDHPVVPTRRGAASAGDRR